MPLTVRQRTIHSKNGAKRPGSINKGKKAKKGGDGEYLVTNAPSDLKTIYYPGGAVALGLLLAARLAAAHWGHINDCDETFNYWEPLHYLVYGSGMQTWEYSPEYAIRSYTSLWFFAVPAKILSYVFPPVTIFYTIRGLLAVLISTAELLFYKSICSEFGVHVARLWLSLTLLSAGPAATVSLLPSSWSNALCTAALACCWRRLPSAVAFVAASVLLSWPFTALIGLPIAVDMLFIRRRYTQFIKWSVLSLLLLLGPTIAIDSWYYGKLVIAPYNIVKYNIFTTHGPDLYGVEPWTYYFVNGFLNFNIVWVLALSCPLLLCACAVVSRGAPRPSFCSPYWLSLMPLFLWLGVFMLQPHKEERFLYPVYSMIVLCGAISVDCVQKMSHAVINEVIRRRSRGRRHYLPHTAPLMFMIVLIAGAGGISRSIAQYNNYHSPMRILSHLPQAETGPQYVCFGKDWYRSPSSFHLPSPEYSIRFIKSEFDGQMPAPFSDLPNATRLIHPYFNDMNEEDTSTYLDPNECHYLVDSDVSEETDLEPYYHLDNATWEVARKERIINQKKSPKLFRAFYIPILSDKHNVYSNLYLLKNKNL